jgi:hypothetical protein
LIGALRFVGATTLLLGACTTIDALTRVPITLPPPPPEARAALGPATGAQVTGIIIDPLNWGALPATPWVQGAPPVTGGGMLASMRSGCVDAAVSPSTVLAPYFLPFTCAGGAAVGSVGAVATGSAAAEQARTSADVALASTAFSAAVAAIKPTGDFGDQLLAQSAREGLPLLLVCAAMAGCAADNGGTPSAWLRLSVQPVFVARDTFNPVVTLYVTVRGRVLDPGGAVLAWRCWRYRSPAVSYFALAEHDATRLRAELDWAWKALAARIADDLFRRPAEVKLLPEGRPGEALPLSGSGAHLDNGTLATRDMLQSALDVRDMPPVQFECLGP